MGSSDGGAAPAEVGGARDRWRIDMAVFKASWGGFMAGRSACRERDGRGALRVSPELTQRSQPKGLIPTPVEGSGLSVPLLAHREKEGRGEGSRHPLEPRVFSQLPHANALSSRFGVAFGARDR